MRHKGGKNKVDFVLLECGLSQSFTGPEERAHFSNPPKGIHMDHEWPLPTTPQPVYSTPTTLTALRK